MRTKLIPLAAAIALMSGGTANAADTPPRDLQDTTCAQYLQALTIANPGAKPTAKRAAQAVSAQDDIVNGLMWVHGYLSGRDGVNSATRPLTREWMISYVGKLAGVCRASPVTTRFVDAASKL